METEQTVFAGQVLVGDVVTATDGKRHVVTGTSPGMYRNSVLIEWRGGWACIANAEEIIVTR